MVVARTSMIHAAAPHFLWPFAVRYAAHELKLWPRISLLETSPTLRWTREVGDASVFRVWGSRAFVRDNSADKLSARAIPCVFLGFVPDAPGWQFYHPTSRRLTGRHGPVPSGVSQVDPLPHTASVEVAVVSGAARGAASGGAVSGGVEPGGAECEGAGSGGAEPRGEEPGGAEPEGVEPGGVESKGAESGGAEPRGAALSRGPGGASLRLSPQQLLEWFVRRARRRSGATRAGGAGVTARPGGARGTAGPGGARTRGTGAAGTSGVEGAGQVLGVPSSPSLTPPLLCPPPDQLQLPLQPASPLPAPSPYTKHSGGLTERHELASCPVSPVRSARRVPRSRPPSVPGKHAMALRPSSVALRVPLPAQPESSLPEVPDPASDRSRAASRSIARLLATAVIDPSFESAVVSALVVELVDFAAACRLDYTTAFDAGSECASPLFVGG
ncbi:unnamed protein product [Closterium sp. NIES-53]